jgi:hypothetical protein
MDKWLEVPKDRARLPVGRLCLMMALTILVLLAYTGRKAQVDSEIGAAEVGVAVFLV